MASEWQPIETAPEDGTRFLALIPFRKSYHQMVGYFPRHGNFVSWPGRWSYAPTHWMPLPDLPKGARYDESLQSSRR